MQEQSIAPGIPGPIYSRFTYIDVLQSPETPIAHLWS